jgi:hypothetical protein
MAPIKTKVANLYHLTLNPYSSLNVIQQDLYIYKERTKLIFDLYIFIKQRGTLNILTEWCQLFPKLNMPLTPS